MTDCCLISSTKKTPKSNIIFMLLVYAGVINNAFIFDLAGYMSAGNYVLMYVIIIGMSYMISTRFAKGLFKNSVMSTYKEEV